jgi:N utilization substance protein B
MQTLFELEFREKGNPKYILDKILEEFAPKLTELDFANETLEGVIENKKEIIKMISKYAPQWPVDKIAKIDRAILEIGIYEIAFSNVPLYKYATPRLLYAST